MFRTIHFETAIEKNGYNIESVKYGEGQRVQRVDGSIPILKRATVNGKIKYIQAYRLVRWDERGKCFSRGKTRIREFDLPLTEIKKELKM